MAGGIAYLGWQIMVHPRTPLPPEWNPVVPLKIAHPLTPLTVWKLGRAEEEFATCLAALEGGAELERMEPYQGPGACGIAARVRLSAVGPSGLDPVETSCPVALRLAMWNRHGVQPAAQEIFGQPVSVIRQLGSYNCRPVRTPSGRSTRLSTHATAEAIDISGFDLADGRRIRLLSDWSDGGDAQRFLRAVRDSACTYFATTLSPDYNNLHADHFHLQSRGRGACR
ncbi:extensin family protein [Celeribacter indicus]|nr:extensin family protein [Celeribacter indicus]